MMMLLEYNNSNYQLQKLGAVFLSCCQLWEQVNPSETVGKYWAAISNNQLLANSILLLLFGILFCFIFFAACMKK